MEAMTAAERKREYQKKYHAKPENRAKARARSVAWNLANTQKHRQDALAWYRANRERRRLHLKERLKANPDFNRKGHLRYSFGLRLDEYNAMLAAQGNACAICRLPPNSKRAFAVDHDHNTGRLRGLLCNNCNLLLGHAGDGTERLAAAITYLKEKKVNCDPWKQ